MKEKLEDKLEDKKEKKSKLGFWDKLWNKNKLVKGKTIAVLYFKENGIVEPMQLESKKGFFEIRGQTYHEDRDCVWKFTKTGTPLAMIEEKSLLPIGTQRWYEHNPEEKTLDFMKRKMMECQDHILRGIRNAEFVRLGEAEKTKWDAKTIIIVVLALVVGYALVKGKGLG